MSLDHVDTMISFALVMLLLSLLVTTLVEAVNTLIQRRGYNLQWGVAQVLERMGIAAADAKGFARLVLRHPSVSSSRVIRTNAIRADELARLMVDLAEQKRIALAGAVETRLRAAAAGLAQRAANTAGPQGPHELEIDADHFTAAIAEHLAAAGAQADPKALRARVVTALRGRAEAAARTVAAAASEFSAWFELVMDRSTERYVAWTRFVTLGTAFVLCFLFHIDSGRILKRLSTDDELRAALVASSGAEQREAEGAMLDLESGKRLATEALLDLRRTLEQSQESNDKELAAAFAGDIPDLRTPLQARDWLQNRVRDAATRARIETRLETAMTQRIEQRVHRVREIGSSVAKQLEKTQLNLLADASLSPEAFRAGGAIDWEHVFGILASVALLSLGAPFWFNMLRNLSNLRPILARKVEESNPETKETKDAKDGGK